MANAAASIRVRASAEKVWDLAGGFNSLPDWMPGVTTSELSEGGRLRSICLESGEIIVERLEYSITKGALIAIPLPNGRSRFTDYFSIFTVLPDGENASIVEWSGEFTANGVSTQEAEAIFLGFYEDSLESLKAKFV
jgi:hypothetical protein